MIFSSLFFSVFFFFCEAEALVSFFPTPLMSVVRVVRHAGGCWREGPTCALKSCPSPAKHTAQLPFRSATPPLREHMRTGAVDLEFRPTLQDRLWLSTARVKRAQKPRNREIDRLDVGAGALCRPRWRKHLLHGEWKTVISYRHRFQGIKGSYRSPEPQFLTRRREIGILNHNPLIPFKTHS